MRIDKGINISKISDNAQRITERTFLKQKPDVFVKSGNTANVDLKSKIDKVLKSSVAILGLGASAKTVKNNIDADKLNEEKRQSDINNLKQAGFDDETIEKICACNDKNKFQLRPETIKTLSIINREEPEFFENMMANPDNIKHVTFVKASPLTSFLTSYKAGYGNNNLEIYEREDGLVINKTKTKKSANKTVSTEKFDWIVDTNEYRKTTSVTKENSPLVKHEETSVVSNNIGLMHKYKKDYYFGENKKLLKTVKEDIDGTKTLTEYKYNDKNKPEEIVSRVFSGENILDSETKTHITYEEYKESEFSLPEYIPTKNIESIDYKNNTVTKTVVKTDVNEFVSQEKTIKNPKTGKISKEIIEKSEIDGVLNSKIIDESGKEKIESRGVKDKDGNVNIEKHFTSFDGTKTDYKLKKSENEFELFYQITDKDGKPLTTVDRTYKRVSPERTYSSLNGHRYAMTSSDTGIKIEDLTLNETKEVQYEDLISYYYDEEKAIEFVKNLPADLILNLTNKGLTIDFTDDLLSSVYVTGINVTVPEDLFVFAHESGHSKDYHIDKKVEDLHDIVNTPSEKLITENKEFRRIFEEEKAAVMKNLSPAEQKHISYFIDEVESQGGINYSPAEVVAETNALFSGGISPQEISVRAHYLQKYFPKTIACLSKMINPSANIALS